MAIKPVPTYRRHFTEGGITGITLAFNQLADRYSLNENDQKIIKNSILPAFDDLLNSESPNLEDYFTMLGYGSYKETYDLPLSNWVIKFASPENPTKEEIALLNAAEHYGVSQFFCDTYFIPLNTAIPTRVVELAGSPATADWLDSVTNKVVNPYTGELYDEMPDVFDYAIIQRRIYYTEEEMINNTSNNGIYFDHREGPIEIIQQVNGNTKIDYLTEWDFNKIGFSYVNWIKDAIFYYAGAAMVSLIRFCNRFDVSDLHSSNVGYIQNPDSDILQPIIIDWMSFAPMPE